MSHCVILLNHHNIASDVTQETVRKENHALRTITAVMMFFIAFTHYYSQYMVGDLYVLGLHLMSVGRFVIPVFAMISGYFCFSKDGHSEANIKRKMIHILFLIVIFKVFYLILSGIFCMAGVVTPDYVLYELLVLSPSFTFDCYGGTISIMTTQPIWFIYSLFLVYGLFFLLYHFKLDFKWSWLLALPILLIGIVMVDLLPMFGVTEIFGIDVDEKIGGTLYPFIVLPFFVIGYYLHKYKDWIDERLSNRTIWALIIIGPLIAAVEFYLRPDHYQSSVYLGLFIFAIAVFIGTFRVPEDRGRCTVLEYIGKYLTVWMYVFFAGTNFIVRYFLQPYSDNVYICEVAGPFIALALDILLAYGFSKLLRHMSSKKAAVKAEAA